MKAKKCIQKERDRVWKRISDGWELESLFEKKETGPKSALSDG